uniref:Mpv17-like protein 2 n=1 Tax=Panagrolaimus sp. JU765 TaxID=591449 RepID=A0AC34QPJ5_9BILA
MTRIVASAKRFINVLYSPKLSLLTDTVMMCGIYGAGDAIAQYYENFDNFQGFNYSRLCRVAAVGLFVGPMSHFYYPILDRVLGSGNSWALVGRKVIVDLICSPTFSVTFVSVVALMEGKSVVEAVQEYRRKFFEIYKLDLCIWPPAQVINFGLIPLRFRVLYIQAMILLYTTCLTHVRHKTEHGHEHV